MMVTVPTIYEITDVKEPNGKYNCVYCNYLSKQRQFKKEIFVCKIFIESLVRLSPVHIEPCVKCEQAREKESKWQ